MAADLPPVLVADRPGTGDRRLPFLHDAGRVPIRHEAELLTIGFVGDGEAASAGVGAHLLLVKMPHREERPGQLRLGECEQEIRLVLAGVESASQPGPAGVGVAVETRVVAGRYRFGAESRRTVEQMRELQVAVALHAGDRGATGGILPDERRDDRGLELPLEVHRVVRNAKRGGGASGIVQVIERAAAAERPFSRLLVVELHREPDDVVALVDELCGGDRRVDASRHRDDDTHHVYLPVAGRGARRVSARSRSTMPGSTATRRSTSLVVLPRPRLNRMEFWVR